MGPYHLILISFLVIGLSACNKSGGGDQASTNSSTSTVTPILWDRGLFPITLKISSDFSASEITALQDMGTEWKTSLGNQLTFFSMTSTTTNKQYSNLDSYSDSEMGIYKLTSWPSSLPSSALAVTQIFGLRYSDHILISHADILVNYQNFTFSTTHPNTSAYDFKSVILHEMGHFLGLYHDILSSHTIMYPYISTYTENRHPYNADITNVASLYGLSAVTSYSSFLQANAALAASMNGQTGLLVTSGNMESGTVSNAPTSFRAVIEIGADGHCRGLKIDSH